MKVFLSWSGKRSEQVAEAIHHFLEHVIQGLEMFFSKHIEAGTAWVETLDKELQVGTVGILILTKENLTSGWMHYEAGALARVTDVGRNNIVPLAFGIDGITYDGPLKFFQIKQADRQGMLDLVYLLNGKLGTPRGDKILEKAFDNNWDDLEKALDTALALEISEPEATRRDPTSLLTELVESMRRIEPVIGDLGRAGDETWPIDIDKLRAHFLLRVEVAKLQAQAHLLQELRTILAGDPNDPLNNLHAFAQQHWNHVDSRLGNTEHALRISHRYARYRSGRPADRDLAEIFKPDNRDVIQADPPKE